MGKSQPHCDLFYRPVVFCLVLLLCRKKLQSGSDRVNEVHFPRGCIPQEVESGYDVTSCEQIFAKSGRPRDLILYFCFQCGKPFCMYMRQDWRKWKRFHCQTLMISPLGSTKAYLCCTPHPSHLSITSPVHVFEAHQYWPFSTESTRASFPMIPTLGCVYHGYDEINSPGLFSWKPVFSLRKRNLKWWANFWVGCPEKLIKSLFLLSLVLQKFKGNFRHATLSLPPVFMWHVCSVVGVQGWLTNDLVNGLNTMDCAVPPLSYQLLSVGLVQLCWCFISSSHLKTSWQFVHFHPAWLGPPFKEVT